MKSWSISMYLGFTERPRHSLTTCGLSTGVVGRVSSPRAYLRHCKSWRKEISARSRKINQIERTWALQNDQNIRQTSLCRRQASLAAFQFHDLIYEAAKVEKKELTIKWWKIGQFERTWAYRTVKTSVNYLWVVCRHCWRRSKSMSLPTRLQKLKWKK